MRTLTALPSRFAKAPWNSLDRRLLAAGFADALGTGLFLPQSVIYLTRIVGLSPTRVGLGLTIAGCLAIVAAPLSGSVLSHVDARMVVLGCFAASALGFVAYTAVDSFATFVGVAIVIQFASRMERPATAVLALGVTPRHRQLDALGWQYSLRNLGYGIGGLVAALALLAHGKAPFVVLLVANAASYVGAGLLVLRLPEVRPPEHAAGEAAGYREVIRDRAYVGIALLNVIMALHDSLLVVAMPLWIVTRTRAPLPLTGILFALNTVLVVILRARITRNIAAPGGIVRSYRSAAVSFNLACGGFAFAAGAPAFVAITLLVIALAALTRAELATSAGEWFLSVELAPTRLRERYLGVFKTSMAVQQAVGPLLVTTLLTAWGQPGWLVLALLLAAGSLASRRIGGREIARRVTVGRLASPVPGQPGYDGAVSQATQEPGDVGDKLHPVMDQVRAARSSGPM
jgi:Major Facilitator Superfamily